VLGRPKGDSRQTGYYLVFGHPTCPSLPGELPGTSQRKCFHEWKWQHPFRDKPRDDDDDDDDDDLLLNYIFAVTQWHTYEFHC